MNKLRTLEVFEKIDILPLLKKADKARHMVEIKNFLYE